MLTCALVGVAGWCLVFACFACCGVWVDIGSLWLGFVVAWAFAVCLGCLLWFDGGLGYFAGCLRWLGLVVLRLDLHSCWYIVYLLLFVLL